MNEELIIITPELKPGSGGVADYTLRLLTEWRGLCRVRFIVPESSDVPEVSGCVVEQIARHAEALRRKLPTNDGRVLLQYSAYGFDRHGYPRWLLRALTEWKARTTGSLVIMFHEIWTFWPVLNRNYLVQQLHRHAIGKLIHLADAVFTSTPDQAEHLRGVGAACTVQVLPVGSNIPAPDGVEAERDPSLAVSFGLQSTRVRDLRVLQHELRALAAAGVIRRIVTCGRCTSGEVSDAEQAILSALPLADGFEQRGALSNDDVSALLAHATFGISAQDPLSLQKSGTFMAYAAHGLCVVSPHADPVSQEPRCFMVHPRELVEGYSADEMMSRAASLRDWQKRMSSWPEIAERFASALHLTATPAR